MNAVDWLFIAMIAGLVVGCVYVLVVLLRDRRS